MSLDSLPPELRAAFAAIVEGRSVKRARHELHWGGRDVSREFVEVLAAHGYRPMTVADAPLAAGERIPAFLLEEGTAYFGWVFWEKFTSRKLRKLFGSVVRNAKGDWAVQIPSGQGRIIYANPDRRGEMEIDHPSGL
jgi:hypothetical protein